LSVSEVLIEAFLGTNYLTLTFFTIFFIALASNYIFCPQITAKIFAVDCINSRCMGSFSSKLIGFGGLFGPLQKGWPYSVL